jgi:hypothetical protein
MINNQLEEHSIFLIEHSKKYVIPEDKKLVLCLAGIIEEIMEFENATNIQDQKLEFGDVIAYFILLQEHIQQAPLIENEARDTNSLIQLIAGTIKRIQRDDLNIDVRLGKIQCAVMYWIQKTLIVNDFDLSEILAMNKNKLESRIQLKGEGNDR